MQIIEAIEIKNYKSIISEKIELDNKIALIGANESGKSNVLAAFNHLQNDKQKSVFTSSEQNISVKHSDSDTIEITYHIKLTSTLTPVLVRLIPNLENTKVKLTKSGKPNETPLWSLEIPKLPKFGNLVIIAPGEKNKVVIRIKKNGQFNDWIENNIGPNYFVGGGAIRLNSNPFPELVKLKKITVVKEEEEKKTNINRIIRDEILHNIQIYFWKYDKDDYLSESISLEDYCSNWKKKKYSTVTGIFKIAKDENAFVFEISTPNLRKYLLT